MMQTRKREIQVTFKAFQRLSYFAHTSLTPLDRSLFEKKKKSPLCIVLHYYWAFSSTQCLYLFWLKTSLAVTLTLMSYFSLCLLALWTLLFLVILSFTFVFLFLLIASSSTFLAVLSFSMLFSSFVLPSSHPPFVIYKESLNINVNSPEKAVPFLLSIIKLAFWQWYHIEE